MAIPSEINLFIIALVLLLIAGLILPLGRQLARPRRRPPPGIFDFFGTASLGRALQEVVALDLILVAPMLLLGVLALVTGLPTWAAPAVEIWLDLFLLFSPVLFLVLLPLWMAVRLTPPEATAPRPWLAAYARVTVSLTVTLLLVFTLDYVLLPAPLLHALNPAGGWQLLLDLWPLAGLLAIAATVVFVFVRGALELVRFVTGRSYRPALLPIAARDATFFYPMLIAAGLITLVLWITSFVFYSRFPDLAYIPPSYALHPTWGLPFTLPTPPTPLERAPLLMLATAIPHLLTLLLSLFIAIYFRPAEPAGRLFALLCLLYGLSGLEVFPRWGGVAFYTLAVLATIFISPTLLHFALVFPRQEEAIAGAARRWWSWLRTALYAPFILLAPFWLFFSLRSGEILAQMQTALMTPEALTWRDLAGALGVLLGEGTNLLLRSVAWVIGGYALVCAWRTLGQARRAPQAAGAELAAAARAQNQLKWVALGAGVAGTGLMLWTLLLFPVISHMGGWGDVVIKLFLMALPLATAVAILGYRLWDADVLINRTLVYGTLTGLLAGVYALVVAALSGLVGRTSPFPSLIAALVVAALFGRGRDWVQDRVDRAFYRSKLEFRRHLRELRQMLSTTIVRNDLVRLLTVTVPERLQLAEAWLVEPAMVDLAQAEQGLLERGAALVLPLAVGEETVGLYGLGSKRSGVPLNREERDLLTDLSYQAAVALANAQTNEALLAEYKRRERMLMEIHDTVLGELGAAMVGIENAKTRIVQQPAEAQHRLAVAQDAVRASMKELRQVITVLRPELPRLSLPEALQREMTRFARRGEFRGDFHVQGEPRLLSDSIIETLAGITREALNNVLKHAKADQVNVVLAYEEHRIRLVVRDNGVGFQPEQRTQGTGLRNMARRAEEAGGTLLVQSTPGEGTRIEVWIPTKEPALSEVKGGGNEN